ncbi:hypothetical protein CC2G_003732 [Coprinopsis cinerea AmutBmut pab1-1]|nr:hypothetical protein CC2G_003732 [Coprinopsis cinerea AmutBmut pab1-1]
MKSDLGDATGCKAEPRESRQRTRPRDRWFIFRSRRRVASPFAPSPSSARCQRRNGLLSPASFPLWRTRSVGTGDGLKYSSICSLGPLSCLAITTSPMSFRIVW